MTNNSVLIVDDTPVNLKLVRVLLSRHGFDVRTANSAEEALPMVEDYHPRLVLADIQLPGMSGLEMTRRIKSAPGTRDTVVLALTAFAVNGDEERALQAGCDGYITKPIDTRAFPALIRKFMGNGEDQPLEEPKDSDDSMRQAFLAEGLQQCGRLIGTLGSRFDHADALTVTDGWTATAASFGYAEIGGHAHQLESLLSGSRPATAAETREKLVTLAQSFTDALRSF